MLRDLLKSRGILWLLVRREFTARYAGSNLGVFWNIVHPIVIILTYLVVFSKLMGSRMPGSAAGDYAFAVHLTSGIIPWFFFSEILSRSCSVLVENAGMLKKMAIPEEVLYLSVFLTALIVHGLSLFALMGLLMLAGVPLDLMVLLVFPVMVALGLTALGIGMVLSVMNLLIRDVGQFVTITLNLMFWSIPIVYPVAILPEKVAELIRYNPIYGFFGAIQMMFGSPAVRPHFNEDYYWIMMVLPFAAIVVGRAFVLKRRSEILDAL